MKKSGVFNDQGLVGFGMTEEHTDDHAMCYHEVRLDRSIGGIPMNNSRFLTRVVLLTALLLLLAVLATGCAGQAQSPLPTPTPLPWYATTAADPGWQSLQQRALHLPALAPGAACPTTHGHLVQADLGFGLGNGPAYPIRGTDTNYEQHGMLPIVDAASAGAGAGGWGGNKQLWVIAPTYHGFVLIRGHQLAGPREVRFNGGVDQPGNTDFTTPPLPALRLVAPVPWSSEPWVNWPSQTRLQAPGCYAYQVDGTTWSLVIVFQAVAVRQP